MQLGYAIGAVDEEVTTKKFYVTPEGFEVSAKATKLHGISQERLMAAGKPLEEVLREFLSDVVEACSKGGRVVAHQIEVSVFRLKLSPGPRAATRRLGCRSATP